MDESDTDDATTSPSAAHRPAEKLSLRTRPDAGEIADAHPELADARLVPMSPERIQAELESQLGMSLKTATREAWTIASRLTKSSSDAKEICQKTFERLSGMVVRETLHITAGRGLPYLRRAVTNTFLDQLKATTILGNQVLPIDAESEPYLQIPERYKEQSAEAVAVANAYQLAITNAIELLSNPMHQRILKLLINGGKNKTQIADLLGIPPSTLDGKLKSARREIKSILRRSGWEVDY